MSKKILSVGFELASGSVEYCKFDSNKSLLDWDLVLFRPSMRPFYGNSETFQGKSLLSEWGSFRLKEVMEHWRREIKDAVESGKTVFVFMPPFEQVYVHTGK